MIQIKKFNFVVITTLIILSSCTPVISQSNNPKDFGASYQVEPGEEMDYEVTVFNYPLQTYTTLVLLSNNSMDSFNITLGTIINFKILNKSIDKTGSTIIFSQMHIFNKKTGYNKIIVSNRSNYYFDYAFNNLGDLYAYFDYYSRFLNSQSFPKQTIQLTNISDSYIAIENKIDFNLTYDLIKTNQNWKTGWYESIDISQFSNDGSLIYEIRQDRILTTPTNNPSTLNNILDTFIFLSVLLVVFFSVTIIFIYYSSSSKIDNKRPKFKQFLKNKFKMKQKKEGIIGFKTDKAFEIIEEILNESKNQE